jgi:hypothetical protein
MPGITRLPGQAACTGGRRARNKLSQGDSSLSCGRVTTGENWTVNSRVKVKAQPARSDLTAVFQDCHGDYPPPGTHGQNHRRGRERPGTKESHPLSVLAGVACMGPPEPQAPLLGGGIRRWQISRLVLNRPAREDGPSRYVTRLHYFADRDDAYDTHNRSLMTMDTYRISPMFKHFTYPVLDWTGLDTCSVSCGCGLPFVS